MCARSGIRQAYSQAYRPQANGRAEVAGKTLIGLLRKMHTDEGLNWVEALPRVLRVYHDSPAECGYTPFQMVFGRDRNLAGVPYEQLRECEGATEFFDRVEKMEKVASHHLNALHEAEVARHNAKLKKPPRSKREIGFGFCDPGVLGLQNWKLGGLGPHKWSDGPVTKVMRCRPSQMWSKIFTRTR